SVQYQDTLHRVTDYFVAQGNSLLQAQQQAIQWIGQQVQTQASFLAYMDVFWVLMLISLVAVPLALALRKVKLGGPAPVGHLADRFDPRSTTLVDGHEGIAANRTGMRRDWLCWPRCDSALVLRRPARQRALPEVQSPRSMCDARISSDCAPAPGVPMRRPHRRQFLHLAAGTVALSAVARRARAQAYPTRPITLVVPFAAGGSFDVIARVITPRLSEILGQQVVVENVGAAAGIVGVNRVAHATPDGYSVLLGTVGTHAYNPALYKKLPYNPATDFV